MKCLAVAVGLPLLLLNPHGHQEEYQKQIPHQARILHQCPPHFCMPSSYCLDSLIIDISIVAIEVKNISGKRKPTAH